MAVLGPACLATEVVRHRGGGGAWILWEIVRFGTLKLNFRLLFWFFAPVVEGTGRETRAWGLCKKIWPKFGKPWYFLKVLSDGGTEMLQDVRSARDVENPAVTEEASITSCCLFEWQSNWEELVQPRGKVSSNSRRVMRLVKQWRLVWAF